jgi:beta-lactam-binding protein with PASTA domain
VASPRVSLLFAAEPMEKAYVMPDLTGLPLTEATVRAAGAGLKVTNGATEASAASGAVVAGQSPPAGSRVVAGMPVSFQLLRP